MQTPTNTEQKPTIEIDLGRMETIEEKVKQWIMLDEHWTQHNLNRREQLSMAKEYFEGIMTEIQEVYRITHAHSDA